MALSNANGLDRAHHRQQERDGHRLLDPLRRLGRRVRGDQGRAEDRWSTSCAGTATDRAGFDLIPEPVLTKAPSAELRPDQRDDESLPPYAVLDPVMAGYVEGDRSADDLVAEGFDPAAVDRVVGLVDRAEYKRRQMPPGVRISGKAFGKDRRMPITNHYRSPVPARRPRPLGDPAVGRDAGGCLRPRPVAMPAADRTRPGPGRTRPPSVPPCPRGHGRAGRGVPVDRARPLPAARGVGDRHAHRRRAGPPRRPEHAPRLARRALGRPAAGAGRGRPRRAGPRRRVRPPRCSPPCRDGRPVEGRARRGRRPRRTSSGPPGPCPGWPACTGWSCPGW